MDPIICVICFGVEDLTPLSPLTHMNRLMWHEQYITVIYIYHYIYVFFSYIYIHYIYIYIYICITISTHTWIFQLCNMSAFWSVFEMKRQKCCAQLEDLE